MTLTIFAATWLRTNIWCTTLKEHMANKLVSCTEDNVDCRIHVTSFLGIMKEILAKINKILWISWTDAIRRAVTHGKQFTPFPQMTCKVSLQNNTKDATSVIKQNFNGDIYLLSTASCWCMVEDTSIPLEHYPIGHSSHG